MGFFARNMDGLSGSITSLSGNINSLQRTPIVGSVALIQGNGWTLNVDGDAEAGSVRAAKNKEGYVIIGCDRPSLTKVEVDLTDEADIVDGKITIDLFGQGDGESLTSLGTAQSNGSGTRQTVTATVTDPGTPSLSDLFPGECWVKLTTGGQNGDYFIHLVTIKFT